MAVGTRRGEVECPKGCGECVYAQPDLTGLKPEFFYSMLPSIVKHVARHWPARVEDMLESGGDRRAGVVLTRLRVLCTGTVDDVEFKVTEDGRESPGSAESTVVSMVFGELCHHMTRSTEDLVSGWKKFQKEKEPEGGEGLVFPRREVRRVHDSLSPSAGADEVLRLIEGLSLRRMREEDVEEVSEPGRGAGSLSRSKALKLYEEEGVGTSIQYECHDVES